MITFIDTDVLLDVFLPDPKWGRASRAALDLASRQGALMINEMVYARLALQFEDADLLDKALKSLGIRIAYMDAQATHRAAEKWRAHERKGTKRNGNHVDFLIGAHAQLKADQLLTRNRTFFEAHFPSLALPRPEEGFPG